MFSLLNKFFASFSLMVSSFHKISCASLKVEKKNIIKCFYDESLISGNVRTTRQSIDRSMPRIIINRKDDCRGFSMPMPVYMCCAAPFHSSTYCLFLHNFTAIIRITWLIYHQHLVVFRLKKQLLKCEIGISLCACECTCTSGFI